MSRKAVFFLVSFSAASLLIAMDSAATAKYIQQRAEKESGERANVIIVECKAVTQGSKMGLCTAFIAPEDKNSTYAPAMHQFVVTSPSTITDMRFKTLESNATSANIGAYACNDGKAISIESGDYIFSDLEEWSSHTVRCENNPTASINVYTRENVITDKIIEVR